MTLDRIALRKRDVIAALHHARTAAFAEQTLDRDRDAQLRRRGVRVQRGEQARAAAAENQDVGVVLLHLRGLRNRSACMAIANTLSATNEHRATRAPCRAATACSAAPSCRRCRRGYPSPRAAVRTRRF